MSTDNGGDGGDQGGPVLDDRLAEQIASMVRQEIAPLAGQVRGIQSAFDRQAAARQQAQTDRDVAALKQTYADDPEALARLERIAERAKQEPSPSEGEGSGSGPGTGGGVEADLRNYLREVGINPDLEGIDYSLYDGTPAGERKFMTAANAAHTKATVALAVAAAREESEHRDPPMGGGASGGGGSGYTSVDEVYDAYIQDKLDINKAREIAAQHGWAFS